MTRVVLDANVLISGLLSKHGPPGQILDAWLNQDFRLFVSGPIVDEVTRVLGYARIRERLKPGQAENLMDRLAMKAERAEGKLVLNVLTRDKSDNIYLACAVESNADYLVTGNTKHFIEAGARFQGVRILTPRDFLQILESH